MSKATEKLKMTRVYVGTEAMAISVQNLATVFGFRWCAGQKPKEYRIYKDSWVTVNENCRLQNTTSSSQELENFRIVNIVDWEVCELHHRRERTAKKKAQRAKKNPWLKNLGVCPVESGELVDVKYRDGQIEYAIKALVEGPQDRGWAVDWTFDGQRGDITHYRIVKPQPLQPKKVRTTKPDNKVSVGQLIDAFEQGKPTSSTNGRSPSQAIEATGKDYADFIDTNPKKQFGDKSIPLSLWPALASAYGALGLYNGKLKYGANNFKATPVEASVYISAAKRHLEAWAEGEEFDPADGVPNLGGVLANIAILLEARAQGTLIDDRNLGTGYLKEREKLKEIVSGLQVLHAGKNPKHYYKTEV